MQENSSENLSNNNISKVANVEVDLYAHLGNTVLNLKDAIEYDEGTIIKLNNSQNDPIDVYVDDILIAKAQIVALEGNYGIKIVEILNKNKTKDE